MILISALCVPALAEGTGKSYVYDNMGNATEIPDPYRVRNTISDLKLNSPVDMCLRDDLLYILDSQAIEGEKNEVCQARIVVVDRDYHLVREFTFRKGEDAWRFKRPSGIWVDKDLTVYIADRDDNRVVLADIEGNYLNDFGKPDSDLMTQSSSEYYPTKVLTDDLGIIYIMVENEYRGVVTLNRDGDFMGYFGANNVTLTGDILTNLFWRRFMTEAQLQRMQKILPTEYTNFAIDDAGFIYCSRGPTADMKEMIRKINCKSKNVLANTDGSFGDKGLSQVRGLTKRTRFSAITVDEKGFISVLDSTWNRIFQYTPEGHLMFIFGGQGNQDGTFQAPADVESWGDDLLVLDSDFATLTVFEPTTFGANVRQGEYLYTKGEYTASLEPWEAVKTECMNYLFAYTGIGQAQYMQKDYKNAMANFKLAGDQSGYSSAFQMYRGEVTGKLFVPVFLLLLSLIVLLLVLNMLKKKGIIKHKKLVLDQSGKFKYAVHTLFHPIDGYQEMRYNRKYSMPLALIFVFLYFFTDVLIALNAGFIFNGLSAAQYNIFITLLMDVGVIALFALANWLMSTFFEGKGRLKEVWIYLCYATMPMIVHNVLYLILSNVLTQEEGVFLTYMRIIFLAWMLLMGLFALQGLHMYNFRRNILSIICTVLAMLVVLFIVFLMFNLFIQFFSFLETVFTEAMYRIVVGF
ncbi:MAG: hypothetical protein HFJ80_05005 [Clostridiales bacterium]|nr:hypothetical protein [Clostridiales bacterium]